MSVPSSQGMSILKRFVPAAPLLFIVGLLISSPVVSISTMRSAYAASAICNCVVFRYDDAQDFWLQDVQRAVMDQFLSRGEHLSVAIIMNWFGNDSTVVSKVYEGTSHGLFETTIHGWNHVDYSKMTLQAQQQDLVMSENKMQYLFGRQSGIFVMPYNHFNSDTLTAMKNLGMQAISAETAHDSYPYFIANGSDIKDSFGIYHMPQMAEFADHSGSVVTYYPVSKILNDTQNAINKYGYAVIVIHPQEFRQIVNGQETKLIDPQRMQDLSDLIDGIKARGISLTTFSSLASLQEYPLHDVLAPTIATNDITVVSSQQLTPVDIGTPSVVDNVDPSPSLSNNAPSSGFPQGTTAVTWAARDEQGNTGQAIQFVTVSQQPDTKVPNVAISSPMNGDTINGPPSGMTFTIKGSASDGETGVKSVEVRTSSISYRMATPKAFMDWSTWSYNMTFTQSQSTQLIAKATDYYGNQKWYTISVTVSLQNDVTPPVVTASPPGGTYKTPQNVTLNANELATIYYTTDGTIPTTSSTVYGSPILIPPENSNSNQTTLKFLGKDPSGNISPVKTEVYIINASTFPVTWMSDPTVTTGLSTYSGRQAHVELATASSQLIGKSIDQITIKLKKGGTPTGNFTVGIFNPDLSVKKSFGTKDASTLTTSYADYTFSLTGGQLYTIQSGDRIGIKYTGGSSSNYVAVMIDTNAADPFDGTNSYHQYYTTSWQSFTSNDLYMILKQTHV